MRQARSDPARTARWRASRGRKVVHIADLPRWRMRYPDDPLPRALVDLGGIRTLACRCAAKEDALLGAITVYRQRSATVHRQADRAAAEFRGASGHRDGKCAAHDRDARGAGAADRDRRGVAGHQFARPVISGRCSTRCSRRRIRLCGAEYGSLFDYDGEMFHRAAARRPCRSRVRRVDAADRSARSGNRAGRVLRGEWLVHIVDIADDAGLSRMIRLAASASSSAGSVPAWCAAAQG